MLKTLFSTRNACHLLVLALLATTLTVHAQSSGPGLRCTVEEKDGEGRWEAVRQVDGATGAFSLEKDIYQWLPNDALRLGQGLTFSWALHYFGTKDAVSRKAVQEGEVLVMLGFSFDAKQAEVPFNTPTWGTMHLYRSAGTGQRTSIALTSLTNVVNWNQFKNGNAASVSYMSLDSVLAFGTGLEALVWEARGEPDTLGRSELLATGSLPIAPLRNKVSMIPKLGRLLDRKSADFRTECSARSDPQR